MQPELSVNYLAVVVCAVAAMPVGFAWFGPVFGRAWAREMGFESMERPGAAAMARSMGLFFLGSLLIAFVLAHGIAVWRPSTWGGGEDMAPHVYALNGALWTWVGYFVPLQLGRVAWEQKGWRLVAINAGFDLVRLLLFGFVLAYWT